MQQMRVKFAFKESENDDDEWSTNHGSVNSDYESNILSQWFLVEKAARIRKIRGEGAIMIRGDVEGGNVGWREDEIGWDERRTGVTSNAARLRVLYYSAPSERVIIDEAVFA